MKAKYLLKELGTFAFCLSGAFLIAALVMSIVPAKQASAASGAIWTTTNACGAPGQDINHFSVGEHVYINGSDFDPNTSYAWTITGNPGSSDPGIIVASGNQLTDSAGAFCFDAYTVAADDNGEYKVDFGGKNDNYGVGAAVPTGTSTNTPTDTPTGTLTNTSTSTPTFTSTSTSTTTPTGTSTNTPTNTPSGTFVVPNPTNTLTNTPTGTFIPATSTNVPFSPTSTNTPDRTSTNTPVTPTSTNTPEPGTPTPIPVPVNSPGPGGSSVVFPVTGVDLGAFSRGLPIAFANLCLGFLGLGLILHGVARRLEK